MGSEVAVEHQNRNFKEVEAKIRRLRGQERALKAKLEEEVSCNP